MIKHVDLGKNELSSLIRKRKVRMAGNLRLKIYGTLQCNAGKRMKKVNRVFFASSKEAEQKGFRPCALCMHCEYQHWRIQQEMG
jgi:methylphosphotriester-DNA--protein-cysteine methyltransferase